MKGITFEQLEKFVVAVAREEFTDKQRYKINFSSFTGQRGTLSIRGIFIPAFDSWTLERLSKAFAKPGNNGKNWPKISIVSWNIFDNTIQINIFVTYSD